MTKPMARSLDDWLKWIESLYPRHIELGLERVDAVLTRMGLRVPPFGVIAVAGTNGKGSTVAMCDAILRAAGYRVGAYTSPHLVRYNERIRVAGEIVTDAQLCTAFASVEALRGDTPLTYFEFGTLAALETFRASAVDVAVLEVGMGGRLDAVNGVDSDVAIVTAIGIDHVAWLGHDRETIGREKAGIFRSGRPAICSDPAPPKSIAVVAETIGAPLWQYGTDFHAERDTSGWTFRSHDRVRPGLPYPALRGDYQLYNAAGVLAALEAVAHRFPVTQADIRSGLIAVSVPGRFQVLPGLPVTVLDVAHNAQAAQSLAATLRQQRVSGQTIAVFGMLADKAIDTVVAAMSDVVDRWHVAPLASPRGASTEVVVHALMQAGVQVPTIPHGDVVAAYEAARMTAGEDDRVVVFGSFYIVGDILTHLGKVPV